MRSGIIVPSRDIILPRYRDSDYDRYVPQRPAFKYPLIRQAAVTLTQHQFVYSNANSDTASCTVTSTAAASLIVVSTAGFNLPRTVTQVTDNIGNTYTQATGSVGSNTTGASGTTDVWYCLSASAGVTSVSVKWSVSDTADKVVFVHEVAGFSSVSFDLAAVVNNGIAGVSTDINGASVTTTGTTGFVVGVVGLGIHSIAVNPKAGNEFTAGGDIDPTTGSAACSLISSTAAAHQPIWTDTTVSDVYVSSTAAFKGTASGGDTLMPGYCL